jgi:hypothetical protein
MKTKKNENGKIDLYLGRDLGSNIIKVGEFDTLSELKKEAKRLLREGAVCANNLPAREFAYQGDDGNLIFGWVK